MTDTWYDRAKRKMRELGLTQEDLKKPLGVKTRGAVGHYLTGRRDPSPQQLQELAAKLKINVDELLRGTPTSVKEDSPGYGPDELTADIVRMLRASIRGWSKLPSADREDIIKKAKQAVGPNGTIQASKVVDLIEYSRRRIK